jgi:hypothetical protein
LMYFMSERSLNSRGSINLLTAVICVTKKHKTRLEIDTGEGVFHLRAKVTFISGCTRHSVLLFCGERTNIYCTRICNVSINVNTLIIMRSLRKTVIDGLMP